MSTATPGLGMSVARLEAFSDGVFAIVVTLLILDIKVPRAGEGSLAAALGRQCRSTSPTWCRSSSSASSG